MIGVFEPGTYTARRVRRIRPRSASRRFPGDKVKPVGARWSDLDGVLFGAFDLPWPRGTILRVPSSGAPIWLNVVDIKTRSGLPAMVCEVLVWHRQEDPPPAVLRRLDTHRTDDTVEIVRGRVVDTKNRLSVAAMKRHLGVRHANERVPFRVTVVGFCPSGITVVGRRRVTAPASGSNAVEWRELETVVGRLVGGKGRVVMDDLDPTPWG